MKNVLVIAYVFPPTGGGGVQRTLKFVKYLPSFGWRPLVLTPMKVDFGYFDYSLVDEIPPEAKVYHTISLEVPEWYAGIKEKYFDEYQGAYSPAAKGSWHRRVAISLVKPIFKSLRWVAHNLIFVPDTHVGWIPFAVWNGVKIARREGIEAIYATGDPWSDFLIALFVSRLTGKPFIKDMRDPWTLSPQIRHGRVRTAIEEFWESRCIRAAFKVINITEEATQAYRKRYPDVDPSKFECITQGFDPPDFEGVRGIGSETFTITSTSTYYDFRTPESFLKGMRCLVDWMPNLESEIRIRFMGIGGEIVNGLVEKQNLTCMVEVLPYGAHRESIQLLMNSDVLLLDREVVTRNQVKIVTTSAKVFEYLAIGKPILAVVSSYGPAADLIRTTNSGVVADPEDKEEVAKAVYALYLQYKAGTLEAHGQRDLERFTRKNLTRSLAQVLDEAIAKSQWFPDELEAD